MPENNTAEKFNYDDLDNAERGGVTEASKNSQEKPKTQDEIEKEWADKYWEGAKGTKKETEDFLKSDITDALEKGRLELSIVGENGDLTDMDREKIFAYKQFAKKEGYIVGPYELTKNKDQVVAEIIAPKDKRGRENLFNLDYYRSKFSKGGEKISELFSPEAKPIGEEAGMKILGEALEEQVDKNQKKFGGLKINTKEILSKFSKEKLFGQKMKNFIGWMALGTVARYPVKLATEAVGGPVVGMLSGAIVGGTWEGIKAYRGETGKIRELFGKKEELYAKAKEIGEKKNINLNEKLDEYFKIMKLEEEVGIVEGSDKYKLYSEILREMDLSSERWRKTFSGAKKGALWGGFGGFLGGAFGGWLGEHFNGPKDATAAALNAARKEIGREAYEQIQEGVIDTYSKAYDAVRMGAVEGLDVREFSVKAQKGDGLTNIARDMIHDYIAEKRSLGVDINLDKSQLIYAEDSLKNMFGGQTLNPEDVLSLKGEEIASAIEKSQLLTDAGKANLENEFASKISSEEWARMMDYGGAYEETNHFSEAILKEAEEKANAAISINDVTEGIGADAAQRAHDFVKDKVAARAIEEGKNSWFEDLFSTIGAYSAVDYAEPFINEKIKKYKKNKQESKHPEIEEPYQKIGTVSDEYADLDSAEQENKSQSEPEKKVIESKPAENSANIQAGKERTGNVKPIGLDNYEFVEEFPEEKKKTEIDKETEKYIDQSLREAQDNEYLDEAIAKFNKDSKNQKLIRDPLYQFAKRNKFEGVYPGAIQYEYVRNVDGEIKTRRFASIEDMRRYLKNFSAEEKKQLRDSYKKDWEGSSLIRLQIAEGLRNYILSDEKRKNSFYKEAQKDIERLLNLGIKEPAIEEEIRGSEIGNEYPYPSVAKKIEEKEEAKAEKLKFESPRAERGVERNMEKLVNRLGEKVVQKSEAEYRKIYEGMTTEELGLEVGKISAEEEEAIKRGSLIKNEDAQGNPRGGKSIFRIRKEIIGELFEERKKHAEGQK